VALAQPPAAADAGLPAREDRPAAPEDRRRRTAWAAFIKAGKQPASHTMVMGDIGLLEDQVNPVMAEMKLTMTALDGVKAFVFISARDLQGASEAPSLSRSHRHCGLWSKADSKVLFDEFEARP
jgi:hypothetical protein